MTQMNNTQSALWKKLASFSIDEGDEALTFEKRLARENDWPLPYAKRVIDEYKRFVFLCASAGHPCSPSEEVDEAWHLHICYTRSYWDRLCGEVLEKPLHHNPTKEGKAETAKFDDWYAQTLRSYSKMFGQEPPADIWAAPGDRFKKKLTATSVDTKSNWIIPKRPAKLLAGILILAALLQGCSPGEAVFGLVLLVGGGVLIAAAIASLSTASQGANQHRRTTDTGSSCGTYYGSDGGGHSSGHDGGGHGSGDCGGADGGGGDCGGSGCGSGCGGGCGGGCGS